MRITLWLFAALLIMVNGGFSCSETASLHIGFYNVENLFDTIDDPTTFDGQFLSDSAYDWNTDKYTTKINNLATVITSMRDGRPPDFLGLCEVENRTVLEDLVKDEKLKKLNYNIAHIDSKDARGIDVAALYNPKALKLVELGVKSVDLSMYDERTRDILWVKMTSIQSEEVFYFLVNHWPSRRGGLAESEPKRRQAAKSLLELKDSLIKSDPKANLVIMGDFNDEPTNVSITEELGAVSAAEGISNTQVFNAMWALKESGKGTYCFRGNWNMLDQLMVNGNLLNGKTWDYQPNSAEILDSKWLRQGEGKYEGYPLRTFGGRKYLKGYSDHFAVSILLLSSTP
ncbi:MAG: endonuclease/exonuclease/phosphatase family protein [Bacteroidia bacterium]|nr:endonuclease/exonuclease/phosphatase family protein [Bacteroidia bacterium]